MSIQANKAVVRRYFEEAPDHPETCDAIFADCFQFHTIQNASMTPQVVESNPQSEKAAYEWLRSVWSPGWRMTIDDMLAENDRVMVQWTFYGVQQGTYYGLLPTNQPVTYSGINIFRLSEGKIVEIWDIADRLWLWQQLGVLPDLKEAVLKANQR
jgi:predicted ester cyclase